MKVSFQPKEFQFTAERQFHALKHFQSVDEIYRSELCKSVEVSRKEVSKRMEKFGSKFNPIFSYNPLQVLKMLKTRKGYSIKYILRSSDRIEVKLLFNRGENYDCIGWDTLVKKEDYESEHEVKTRIRNGFTISYAIGDPKPTLEMNMIFELSDGVFQLITLFPGKYAPPFPDKEIQIRMEYAANAKFWSDHLFLVQ